MSLKEKKKLRLLAAAALVVIIAVVAVTGYHRPGPAEVLVSVDRFGYGTLKFAGYEPIFRLPLYHKVYGYPVGGDSVIVDIGTTGGRDYPITGDGLAVGGRLVLRYLLDLDGVLRLHETVGPDFRRGALPELVIDGFERVLSNLPLRQIYADDGVELRRLVYLELEPQLADLGLQLAGLAVPRLGPALGDYRSVYPDLKPDGRAVVIGISGLDSGLVEELAAAGGLPNLSRLVNRGAGARVETREPAVQSLLWTSLATGVSADRHGIITAVTGPGLRRRSAALWDMVHRWGGRSAFIGWPGTFPIAGEPSGIMVSDGLARLFAMGSERMNAEIWSSMSAPEDVREEIESLLVWPDRLTPGLLEQLERTDKVSAADGAPPLDLKQIGLVYAETESYRRIAQSLLADNEYSLVAVHLDLVGQLNRLAVPGGVFEDAGSRRRAMLVLKAAYTFLDRVLADFIEALGPDDTLWIVSIQGLNLERGRDKVVGPGMLTVFGRRINRQMSLGTVSNFDLAPSILAAVGLPVPWNCEGRVLEQLFTPEYLKQKPIAYVDTYGGSGGDYVPSQTSTALVREVPQEHISLGRLYLTKGEYRRAEAEFRRAVELDPADKNSHATLGEVLLLLGKSEESMESFRRALRLDPKQTNALNGLGRAMLVSGRPDEAIVAFKQAIDIAPEKADIYCNLGVAYEAKGMFASAVRQYKRALDIDPDLSEAHFCLGNYHSNRGELEEAERSYKAAMRSNPKHVGLYINLGFVYARQVKLDEAEAIFRQVIEMAPNRWEGYLNLGRIHMDRRNFPEAEGVFRDAVKRFPTVAQLHNSLAESYQLQGRLPEAANEYERAVALNPGNTNYQANLQNTRTMIERSKEARTLRP
ncbi:tetratricopeptide repeat protein [candidate division KSB1 bacterium]